MAEDAISIASTENMWPFLNWSKMNLFLINLVWNDSRVICNHAGKFYTSWLFFHKFLFPIDAVYVWFLVVTSKTLRPWKTQTSLEGRVCTKRSSKTEVVLDDDTEHALWCRAGPRGWAGLSGAQEILLTCGNREVRGLVVCRVSLLLLQRVAVRRLEQWPRFTVHWGLWKPLPSQVTHWKSIESFHKIWDSTWKSRNHGSMKSP